MRMDSKKIVRAGLIAAVYVALCMALAPISYGPVQIRVAEALTLLPVLFPEAVVGVVMGCLIANLFTGMWLDVVVGTTATLLAALATRRLRHVRFKGLPVAASLPPVLFNAVFVGAALTWLYLPGEYRTPAAYLVNMASVGAGQLVSCCLLGLLLVFALERGRTLNHT